MIPVQSGTFTVTQSNRGMRGGTGGSVTEVDPRVGMITTCSTDNKKYEIVFDSALSPVANYPVGTTFTLADTITDVTYMKQMRLMSF